MLHTAIDPMYYVNGSISLPRTCPYPAAAPDHSDRFKRVAALIEAHNISLGPGFAPTIANPLLAMPGKAPIIAVIVSRREPRAGEVPAVHRLRDLRQDRQRSTRYPPITVIGACRHLPIAQLLTASPRANIKLSSVITNVLGASGRRMLKEGVSC